MLCLSELAKLGCPANEFNNNNKLRAMTINNPSKAIPTKSLVALSLVCGAALHSQSAKAAIYTYLDKDGTRWLTNAPKTGAGAKYKLVASYGAPQPRKAVRSNSISSETRTAYYAPGNLPVSSNGVSTGHCGGQTLTQLENRVMPHLDSIRTFAQQYGVEENLVRAVMKQESCFNSRAMSSAGAMGLMQLMPGTADLMGVDDAWDPHQNIQGGVKYLAKMLREFNGDKQLALAAYNAGPGAVRKYSGIPPYRETQNYVMRIMSEYNRLQTQMASIQPSTATGFQRTARVVTGSRGYGWARPVENFSVFKGRNPDNV